MLFLAAPVGSCSALNIGCCNPDTDWPCTVNAGDCTCDQYCHVSGTCCADILQAGCPRKCACMCVAIIQAQCLVHVQDRFSL